MNSLSKGDLRAFVVRIPVEIEERGGSNRTRSLRGVKFIQLEIWGEDEDDALDYVRQTIYNAMRSGDGD